MEIISVEEAKTSTGLRLGLVAGLPSPWGEAAKGIFQVSGIPFQAVPYATSADTAFRGWTGHDSAPVAVYNDEHPRAGWDEILLLADRLAPATGLIPVDAAQRAEMFGLAHEICGEMGLGWCARLLVIHGGMTEPDHPLPREAAEYFASKYDYRPGCRDGAVHRVRELLVLLADRLARQAASGREYLLGDRLSALDIYAATFLAFVAPWGPSDCAMPEFLRGSFRRVGDQVGDVLDARLLDHRAMIYTRHLTLPIELV